MTNATVDSQIKSVDGQTLTVKYKDGEQKVLNLKRSNLATIDDHDPDCLALTRQWRIGLRAQGKVE
jgi:hypothetical protein